MGKLIKALRIINERIGALDEFLSTVHEFVSPGGRIVVLSYHSLEDRRIKRLIKGSSNSGSNNDDTDDTDDKLWSKITHTENRNNNDYRYWVPVVKRALLPSQAEGYEQLQYNSRTVALMACTGSGFVTQESIVGALTFAPLCSKQIKVLLLVLKF